METDQRKISNISYETIDWTGIDSRDLKQYLGCNLLLNYKTLFELLLSPSKFEKVLNKNEFKENENREIHLNVSLEAYLMLEICFVIKKLFETISPSTKLSSIKKYDPLLFGFKNPDIINKLNVNNTTTAPSKFSSILNAIPSEIGNLPRHYIPLRYIDFIVHVFLNIFSTQLGLESHVVLHQKEVFKKKLIELKILDSKTIESVMENYNQILQSSDEFEEERRKKLAPFENLGGCASDKKPNANFSMPIHNPQGQPVVINNNNNNNNNIDRNDINDDNKMQLGSFSGVKNIAPLNNFRRTVESQNQLKQIIDYLTLIESSTESVLSNLDPDKYKYMKHDLMFQLIYCISHNFNEWVEDMSRGGNYLLLAQIWALFRVLQKNPTFEEIDTPILDKIRESYENDVVCDTFMSMINQFNNYCEIAVEGWQKKEMMMNSFPFRYTFPIESKEAFINELDNNTFYIIACFRAFKRAIKSEKEKNSMIDFGL
jgi:hypothetical protein